MNQTRRHRKVQTNRSQKARLHGSSGKKILVFKPNESVHPGTNFYKYVNQKWMSAVKIPPYKVVYGVSEEVEDREEAKMYSLLSRWITKRDKKPTGILERYEHCLGILAHSVLTSETQTKSKQFLQNLLTGIQSLQSKEEVAVILGEFARYRIPSFLSLYAQYENKNRQRFTYSFGYGSLGLPDATYYLKRTMDRAVILEDYKTFLTKVGKDFQINDLACIVKLEKRLARRLWKFRDDKQKEWKGSDLERKLPNLPLDIFFKTHGLSNWRDQMIFTDSFRWLHTVNHLFVHLSLVTWRRILSAHVLLYCLSFLPKPYSDLSFDFYRKRLRGQKEQLPPKKRALMVLQRWAMPFFSRLYAGELVNPDVKPAIEQMLKELQGVAQERLTQVEWLETPTRRKAVEKVKAMRSIVAFPDSYEELSIPKLQSNHVLLNLFSLGEWKTKLELKKLGRTISQRKDWEDPVFIVNAYYYPQANEIVIPSGILNYPFYDASTPLGWNYGGIGCVLGHELTHAFDNDGKEYDPRGYLEKWWTPTDNRNYNKMTKSLIQLYGKQTINGHHVAGRNTLGENISDIGGMAIALDALKQKLDSLCKTEKEKQEAYRQFFLGFATSWRYKDLKKKRLQALFMDKHAPPSLRVNLVVSQFKEWYSAFEIQETDPLYIPPEKRITLF
jgi:predicted metalloendopeptidase